MAASIGKHTKVTLNLTRLICIENSQRSISTSRVCYGNTWHVFGKPRRENVLYKAADATGKPLPAEVDEIKVPNKIERSPTAILEALASTVKNDVNQPMYVSIDDPHLYLTTDRSKKTNLAAMESGRKTAQMMLSMYPDYFKQIWQEPLPDSWRGAHEGYKHREINELALLERIEKQNVDHALKIYTELVKEGQPLKQETLEKLLELVTVYANKSQKEESDLSIWIEDVDLERFEPFPASSWKKGNKAEEIFASLPEKSGRAYNNMVRAMASCHEKVGALELYEEMKTANLPVYVGTFNGLLRLASLDSETLDDVIPLIENPPQQHLKSFVMSSTMEKANKDQELGKILNKLSMLWKARMVTCKSVNDVLFFRTVMRVVRDHFPDSQLALRIHNILKSGQNYNLIGHRQIQFQYYTTFFSVVVPLEPIDVVMDLYSKEVPFNYSPTQELYMAILDSIQMHDSYEHIPTLYADLQWSAMFRDRTFAELFVKTMAKQKNEPELQIKLCDIAKLILMNWKDRLGKPSRDLPYMDGFVLGELMTVYLNNGQWKDAWELFELYRSDRKLRVADPSEKSMMLLAEQLIENKNYESTKVILETMLHHDYSGLRVLVDKTLESFSLSDQERNYLQGLASDVPAVGSSTSSSSSSDSDSD